MTNLKTLYDETVAGAARIAPYIIRTPLLENAFVNEDIGGHLLVKAECLQLMGAFKQRGAFNALLKLSPDQRGKGVIAYSSGNHAQAIAYAAKILGTSAVIVMPRDAPPVKITNTRRYGAEVVLYDRVNESREEIGAQIANERGLALIPPFDHPDVIAGQGTAGLEIVDECLRRGIKPDAVLVPASGGGLAAGIGTAIKQAWSECEIYVVEPVGFDDIGRSLQTGHHVKNEKLDGSICDAILAPTPGTITFPILQQVCKGGLAVTDEEALKAIAIGVERYHVVMEPGGAVAVAAAIMDKLPIKGRTVVAVASGGNIDRNILQRALSLA